MPMLKAEHLSFSYPGRGSQETLKDLSLEIHPGECLAVVGRNGSGKSTLLSLLAGSLKPGKGSVERQGKLGYVPQENALLEDLSVWENVVFFAALGGVSKKDIPDPLPLGISSFRRKRSELFPAVCRSGSVLPALLRPGPKFFFWMSPAPPWRYFGK